MSDGAPPPVSEQIPSTDAPATGVGPGVVDAETVARWMAGQRWYAAKGLEPRLRPLGSVEDEVDGVRVTTQLLLDEAPATPVLYQVPFTTRTAPVAELDAALVGTDGQRWVYDGPHDPAYARWLLSTMSDSALVGGDSGAGGAVRIEGRNLVDAGDLRTSHVLRGEQSNTSIICDVENGPTRQVIVKVFRVLHHGDNPDVMTQAAISSGGSSRVPTSFGSISGTWPDAGREDGTAAGHLAFAQEFLPGLEDAWRVALHAAADGTSFVDDAEALGVAVAEVHTILAEQLPTVDAGPDEIAAALDSMRSRLDTAAEEVPAVAEHADAIRRVYDVAAGLEWPRLQRIHGDLHLGQALLAGGERGWVLLDFEGEPLRPMPERSRPDVALRDVAGMLRSFDYVAGALQHETPPVEAGGWSREAADAFLAGYSRSAGIDLRAGHPLLDAFVLDKAVYEAVYEARNRPDWLGIPVAAVQRLVADTAV